MAYNGKPSGITPGSYGDDTHVASVTVNDEGQITSVSSIGISTGGTGTVTSVGVSSTDLSVSGSPVTTSGSITLDLNASGVSADTYGDSTHVPQLTVNSKGVVTAVTNVAISSGGSGTVTSVGLSSTDLTVSGSPITTSGSITANLTTTGVTPATYGDANNVAQITVDSKGRITSASNISISASSSQTEILLGRPTSGPSTSAYAFKGTAFYVLENGFTAQKLFSTINIVSGGTYKLALAIIDGSDNITSITYCSDYVASASYTKATISSSLTSPVSLTTGVKYVILCGRSDSTTTYAFPLYYESTNAAISSVSLYVPPSAVSYRIDSISPGVSNTLLDSGATQPFAQGIVAT